MLRRCLLVAALLLPGTALAADAPKSLGHFGAWDAFAQTAKGAKTPTVCYAVSHPVKTGTAKGRAPSLITITHRPADKSLGVISVTPGYGLKKNATLRLDIGKDHVDLYMVDNTGWARDDKAVLGLLKKGKAAGFTLLGTSARDETVRDDFGLNGFDKAMSAIDKACGLL